MYYRHQKSYHVRKHQYVLLAPFNLVDFTASAEEWLASFEMHGEIDGALTFCIDLKSQNVFCDACFIQHP